MTRCQFCNYPIDTSELQRLRRHADSLQQIVAAQGEQMEKERARHKARYARYMNRLVEARRGRAVWRHRAKQQGVKRA